ncbi:bifunctional hydroxymethylpyrimidine kinase/phosphomethylpyrimidine kinase [Epibacterium ulvae]|uniref:bifunctional hydroxymethylpyrimidine kinase/phosphomethylpyrimidine kinase n=1 Tax=Epibacterium ulvae TaxID=1156985 RepID=UPI001BFC3DD3|nr:bifunctional hydroxymethylpyrimidine kinase/phosphomethylpyrimidine kinase [Epibacterium ulvae]MBT8155167.1 bifunctional hydroxymethylpyrimidine kinase/phosphomethylpyrimidine kinase [Epibacterium ulvae]
MGNGTLHNSVQTVAALTIAGSDSGGGAGIQADLKTFSALGVFGCSAITAITAQNTCTVTRVDAMAPGMVAAQLEAVLGDIHIRAIKIGMLATVAVIKEVAAALEGYTGPIVLDPVMVAKSGDKLLADDAIDALKTHLLPHATVLTPNLPEAACLLDLAEAGDEETALSQGRALCDIGAQAVLMKGGHATGSTCVDRLVTAGNVLEFSAPRIETTNTHGTGCTLSSAIAAELAKGQPLPQAVDRAHTWLHAAIKAADRLNIGAGHGPVHHFHEVWV